MYNHHVHSKRILHFVFIIFIKACSHQNDGDYELEASMKDLSHLTKFYDIVSRHEVLNLLNGDRFMSKETMDNKGTLMQN